MNWLSKQVSFYSGVLDKIGRPETIRDILLCESVLRIETLIKLKNLNPDDPDYKNQAYDMKTGLLPLYAPAALIATRETGNVRVQELSGLMQLDFDYKEIKQYDINELKACIFSLPFIAYVAKSCSGKGVYALAAIDEPDRLKEYAEHCFIVFEAYGIKADTSKGRNPQDLRFVSYDPNMLIRDNPEPLHIIKFHEKPKKDISVQNNTTITDSRGIVISQLNKIKQASVGSRWETVQKVSFTLGGLGDQSLLEVIKTEIEHTPEFSGQEKKYLKCAEDCFSAGSLKPLNA